VNDEFNVLDLVAGFAGSLLAVFYQDSTPYGRMLVSIAIGSIFALYGAPALASWMEFQDPLERFCAMILGMTAQTYLIPGIFESASLLAKIPVRIIKKKLHQNEDDDDA
jgi:hypothetical protein